MKITIPENYAEITVAQYKKLWAVYEKEKDGYSAIRRCLEVLANLEPGTLNQAPWEDIDRAGQKIAWLISEPDPFVLRMPLQQRITLEGVDYGFIPDWTRLTVAEYADLETYCNKGMFEYLEKIMSVLYRPIVKEAFDMYDIASYEPSKKRQAVMMQCPMSVVVGAVVFFCNIQKELVTTTQPYSNRITTRIARVVTRFLKSGGGIKSSTN